MKQSFDGKLATLRISRAKRNDHSGTYKCVIKNDSGMVETSATVTIKKVEEKKKKEEENVEETVEVEEEEEEEESDTKLGPFGVKLTKAKQNKHVVTVSGILRMASFRLNNMWLIKKVNLNCLGFQYSMNILF